MNQIKLFETKKIRSVWVEEEQKWFFSVVDVVEVLTDSTNPRDYWFRIKEREKLSHVELSTICRQLKLTSSDGKSYQTDCADAEGDGETSRIKSEFQKYVSSRQKRD